MTVLAAAWTCDTSDGDRDVGVRSFQRALGHHAGDRLRHRSQIGDQVARHAEQLLLGAVGVDHEAALEDVRGAGDRADRAGHQAARAALGGDDAQRALAGLVDQQPRQGFDFQ